MSTLISSNYHLQNGLTLDTTNLIISENQDNFKDKEYSNVMDYYRIFTNDGIFIGYLLKKKKNVSNYISNLLNNVIIITEQHTFNKPTDSNIITEKIDDQRCDKKPNDKEFDEEFYDIDYDINLKYSKFTKITKPNRYNNSKKYHKKTYDIESKTDNNYICHTYDDDDNNYIVDDNYDSYYNYNNYGDETFF